MKTTKGQLDLIYIIVYIIMVVIVLAIIWSGLWKPLETSPGYQKLLNATPTQHIINRGVDNGERVLNNSVMFIFIMMALVSLVLAAFTDSNPIFAIPGILILPAEMIVTFVFHDLFFQVIGSSWFASWVAAFPGTIYLFQYFPLTVFILWLITIIVTFIK